MSLTTFFIVLALSALALGNPITLEERYGGPSHGGHHADHDSNSNTGSAEFSPSSGSASFESANTVGSHEESSQQKSSGINAGNIHIDHLTGGNSGSLASDSGINAGNIVSRGNSGSDTGRVLFSSAAGTIGSPILAPSNDGSGVIIGNDQISEDITITKEVTVDVFTTLLNVYYNSVPVTLTEFVKTTVVAPTLQVLSTPVDDHVFVATAPVTRTDTITVTDTNTAFQCATEVSTDFYTITHRAYDIRQQLVTSTVVQTQVFRPTVVSTRIDTEYETETVLNTVTNTVVVTASTPFVGRDSVDNFLASGNHFKQGSGFQQGAGTLNGVPQSGFVPFNQGSQHQHAYSDNRQQFRNQLSGSYY